jgi:hypothetical protein
MSMPVETYTDGAFDALLEGRLEIPVGTAVKWYDTVEGARQQLRAALWGSKGT